METPGLVAAFFAGILSFLSPCVLPLVPGYLSLITGLQASDVHAGATNDRSKLLFNAVLFVMGFTVVFVVYGAVASGLGSLLLEHRLILTRIAGVLIIVMGLSVAGVFRARWLLSERRLHVSPAALGPFAAPVMGMAFAFGWTPCIGPILAGVLTLAASRETLSQGVGLLTVYSLGLGVPFLVMAFGFAPLRGSWKWLLRHGRAVDRISGGLLVAFGILLLTANLGWLSQFVLRFWNAIGFSGVFG